MGKSFTISPVGLPTRALFYYCFTFHFTVAESITLTLENRNKYNALTKTNHLYMIFDKGTQLQKKFIISRLNFIPLCNRYRIFSIKRLGVFI